VGHAGKACAVVAALATGTLSAAAATPPEKVETCLACHGAEGRSENAEVPSLGAQPSTYTLIQLFMFRERLRLSEPMNAMAKELSDDDLQSIAGAIAALPPPEPPADPGDAARLGQARMLTSRTTATSATSRISPGRRTSRASPTSGRIICSRPCATTRAVHATATTQRWPRSCRPSATLSSSTSHTTCRTCADTPVRRRWITPPPGSAARGDAGRGGTLRGATDKARSPSPPSRRVSSAGWEDRPTLESRGANPRSARCS